MQAIQQVGMPEGRIILSQTAIYLACSAKSNASYLAIEKALEDARKHGDAEVPLHLRNGVTRLMKEMGYGKNYQYAHEFEKNFIDQEFLPESIAGTTYFDPGTNARESEMRRFLAARWKGKYGYEA
jgi:putative ATPase